MNEEDKRLSATTRTWSSVDGDTTIASDTSSSGADAPLRIEDLNEKLAGQYQIRDVLGSGGMGIVYRAKGVKLEREVTIKAILAGRRFSPAMTELLRAEALIVASLAHPNIKQVYDVVEVDGMPLIVMEYVEGMNLEEATRRHRIDRDALLEILIKVCEAVGFAHARGVIHRDIKPSNIILTTDGTPKLSDFGIARKLRDEWEEAGQAERILAGHIMGSPSFMAPEQARGRLHETDSRTDIYSLGATLYFGLTGRPPFKGTPAEIVKQLLHGGPQPLSRFGRVPVDIEAICMKCLERNPSARYRTTYALADDLQAYREGRPIKARRYGFIERARRAIGRRPYTFSFAVTAALTMLGGTFLAQYIHYSVARQSIIEELRAKVTSVAHTTAIFINPAYVEAVRSDEDRQTPECQALVRVLKEIRLRNDAIQDAYIVRLSARPGYVEFVIEDSFFDSDAELDENGNGIVDAEEEPVSVGQVYMETPQRPALMQGFSGPAADEHVIKEARRGSALSGYAPLFDASGKSIAAIWVDMRADKVAERFDRIDRAFYGAIAVLAVLFIGLLTLILLWTIGLWERGPRVIKRSRRFLQLRPRI